MAQSHYLAEFRERTGMTQNALASLLHVNRSLLNMNERSERMLPAIPTLRLFQFTKMMNDPALASVAAIPAAGAEAQEKCKQKFLQYASLKRYEAAKLEKKILAHEKAEAQRGQMRLLLAAIQQLHEQEPPTPHEAKWLTFQQSLGGFYYDYRDWEVEAYEFNKLRHAIKLKEAEAAEQMAKDISGD